MSDLSDMEQAPAGFDIAIVGMAGRFPSAQNLDQFWQNLCDGVEAISFFTDDQFKASGVSSAELASPQYVRAAPVLKDTVATVLAGRVPGADRADGTPRLRHASGIVLWR